MKMIFTLTEKQQSNVRKVMNDAYLEYRDVLDNHLLGQWVTKEGRLVTGYRNDVSGGCFIWLNGIGFLKVRKDNIPDINIIVNGQKLIIEGEREIITLPEIVKKISKILGSCWRVAEPEIEGENLQVKLFWWETLDHYYKWRSDWKDYCNWLLQQFNPDKRIETFADRFRNENICLNLVRSGRIGDAKKLCPVIDDILKFA